MRQLKTSRTVAAATLLALVATAALAAVSVTGGAPKATRGFPSVVMLTGSAGDAAVPGEAVVMSQINKAFQPGVLVARVGQTVTFRNGEGMLHNVHAFDLDSGDTVLNVAQPMQGIQNDHVFDKAGYYSILCDVHPEMEAYVVVTETPHAVVADADGSFELGVLPGDYELRIWNVNEKKQRVENVTVGADGLVIQ